jgi:hypothetical protein
VLCRLRQFVECRIETIDRGESDDEVPHCCGVEWRLRRLEALPGVESNAVLEPTARAEIAKIHYRKHHVLSEAELWIELVGQCQVLH